MADIDDLEEDDFVLWSGKAQPLRVTEAGEGRVRVEGPQGGEYVVFRAPDDPDVLLVAKPGNREYASLVEDLRVVGHWERDDTTWRHTGTGAELQVVETDNGTWTVTAEDIPGPDVPRYGFLERELAVEEAERYARQHPEGSEEGAEELDETGEESGEP